MQKRLWLETYKVSVCMLKHALIKPASIRAVQAIQHSLPYVLEAMPNGKLIFLNRQYKPLGTASVWSDYNDYPNLHVDPLDPLIQPLLLACPKYETLYQLFSFNPIDDIKTAKEYLDRLELVWKAPKTDRLLFIPQDTRTTAEIATIYRTIEETDYCTQGRKERAGQP
jgi:hypothetical protein